ncbi:MAG: hypothetical protein KJO07_20855, partial [Deltaproteobacteria bacterium]|nr:hypothetical protein [Deltaproteobacteria bacterium]
MTKRILIALNVIAIFTFGAFVLWKKLFSEPTAQPAPAADAAAVAVSDPPPVPDAAPPAATEATISKPEGTVELQLEDGSWQPIAAGDTVPKGAKLRTGEGASVTVKLGANEIALSENNSVEVDLTEVTLAKGSQVDAKVAKSEQDFVVKSEGTEAEAIAKDGDFSVVNTGNGVTVATTRGKSRLRAKGEEVEIPKGKQAQVVGDGAPSAPKDIPPE